MNEILGLVGAVCICSAFYLMARKKADKVEELEKKLEKCEILEAEQVREFIEMNEEIKELKKEKDKSDRIINKLTGIIEEDNKFMSKRMEQIGNLQEDVRRGGDRFAKDQITIADLNHELCEANYRVVELESDKELYRELAMSRYDEIRYLRRKLKRVRASRLKKVIKADKLGGVE